MRRALLIGCAALVLAACGEHRIKAAPAPTQPAARLVITTGYGAHVLGEQSVAPGQTVMAALESAAVVTTRYGGRYVQSIDGHEGSADRAEDWLYFVNGIEAAGGAADTPVRTGDAVWWDFRRWNGYIHVPVVVGAWPEPFAGAFAATGVAADPPLDAALARAGARLAQASKCRVLVGDQRDLARRSPAWRRAVLDPPGSGLTAWIAGGEVRVWDAPHQAATGVAGGRAVAAAIQTGGCATMVVAGLDAGAARAAAARIAADPRVLAHRYAVVFSGQGAPLAYGGGG